MANEYTPETLANAAGCGVDNLRIKYASLQKEGHPLFVAKFSRRLSLSVDQVQVLRPGFRAEKINSDDRLTTVTTAGGLKKINPLPSLQKAFASGNGAQKWPLWIVLAITAGASVPNMFAVTYAIKSGLVGAYCWTAAFTVVPFLLILARANGLFGWLVVVGVMGYTAFCNAAAIFGGLTALDSGYILKPTVFLEAVTNLTNTPYLATARTLSGLMAVIIAGIELVAFKNLSK